LAYDGGADEAGAPDAERHEGRAADQPGAESAPGSYASGFAEEELPGRSVERSRQGDRRRDRRISSNYDEQAVAHQKLIEQTAEAVVRAQSVRSCIGSLPHPDVLEQYERIVPGSGTRIIAMAESETTEKARTDRLLAQGEVDSTRFGVAVAAVLGSVCVVAAIGCFIVHNIPAGLGRLLETAPAGVLPVERMRRKHLYPRVDTTM
jgi:uncharacterized membrane protein